MEAQEIKTLRNKLGLSQRQFAKRLGVSKRTVAYWESGKTSPGEDALSKLAELPVNNGEPVKSGESVKSESVKSGESVKSESVKSGESVKSENKFLKQALEYEQRGWSVVQLKARSKVPRGEWKHLQQKRATSDDIKKWWTEYPNGNVGIICGSISGIAVIDIDDIDKADTRVKQEMPTGYQVSTKKGLHAYYTIPKGMMLQSKPKILGVELKAEGSLVAAPPSIHPEGGTYTFKMNGELRELPQWFLNRLQKPQRQGKTPSSDNWVIQAWQGVGEGERNTTAAKLAGHYFGKRLAREEIAEIMSEWNDRNTPPLDHDELMAVIQSIDKTHNRNHPDSSEASATASKASFEHRTMVTQDRRDEEYPQEHRASEHAQVKPHFPTFPQSAWRGVFEDFRLAHTNTTEAADEFLFAAMLATVGAVLGRKCWVWYGRKLYPNFYAVCVGLTARTRKTTAVEKSSDILMRTDPNVLYYRGLASAEGFIEMLSPIHQEDENEIDELISTGQLLGEDAPARYRAQKARLVENVAEFEGIRLLCQIGEFSALLKKSAKDGSAGLTEALIDAYDNPPKLDNPTRTSPLTAPKPSVSMISTTTTGRLMRHLTTEELEGGFANRFVYFVGDRKNPIPLPPEPEMDCLNQVTTQLASARRRWHQTQFHLLDSAYSVWENYYLRWYDALENDVIDPLTGRLPDNALKLALQYAVLENSAPEVLPEQMQAAVEVADYWCESIKILFQSYGMTEAQKIESEILRAVSNGGKSTEELYDYFSRNIDARTLNIALENLQKIGRIAREKKSNGPGRPKMVFRLKENIGTQ